jgi:hypothetical protein
VENDNTVVIYQSIIFGPLLMLGDPRPTEVFV